MLVHKYFSYQFSLTSLHRQNAGNSSISYFCFILFLLNLGIIQLFVCIYKFEQHSDFSGRVGFRKRDVRIFVRGTIHTPRNPIIIARCTDYLGRECSDLGVVGRVDQNPNIVNPYYWTNAYLHCRYYPALKTLEQLEHTYLPRVSKYRFSQVHTRHAFYNLSYHKYIFHIFIFILSACPWQVKTVMDR